MRARAKISATLTSARLREAQEVTGRSNISQLLDEALAALIERELEKRWLEASPDDELPGEVEVDLCSVAWGDVDQVSGQASGAAQGGEASADLFEPDSAASRRFARSHPLGDLARRDV